MTQPNAYCISTGMCFLSTLGGCIMYITEMTRKYKSMDPFPLAEQKFMRKIDTNLRWKATFGWNLRGVAVEKVGAPGDRSLVRWLGAGGVGGQVVLHTSSNHQPVRYNNHVSCFMFCEANRSTAMKWQLWLHLGPVLQSRSFFGRLFGAPGFWYLSDSGSRIKLFCVFFYLKSFTYLGL